MNIDEYNILFYYYKSSTAKHYYLVKYTIYWQRLFREIIQRNASLPSSDPYIINKKASSISDIWEDGTFFSCFSWTNQSTKLKYHQLENFGESEHFSVFFTLLRAACMRVSHRPENSIVGAARLQRDAVSNLVADVYVHLVCNTEGQINSLPSLDLTAHHHTVLVLRRQTQLCTPLRDLKTWTHTISTWMHSTTTLHKPSGKKK